MSPEQVCDFWELLWQDYTARVSYARIYQQMITVAGGTVANDHIAFRSLRMTVDSPQGEINLGIDYLEQVAKFLGYEAAGEYTFPETHLYARHYRHPQQEKFDLPKLFISELIVDELPTDIVQLIYQTIATANFSRFTTLLLNVQDFQQIFTRPWQPPLRSVVEQVNKFTQYGAWVLLHGYAVNHFTGYVNRQNTPEYPDIDSTARGLANLGVPMKAEIEGDIACGLRQTATQAVKEMVTVLDDINKEEIQIPWTYAYYEIAQRYTLEVEPGNQKLFDAFLGNNAQHLFEMTRLSKK
ncbi:DUF1338 domain-containing protein [Nostocaceae cyanobacterium CENA369]|uniref:2-oxoadipate dioxygenase/decarboxylase n=1 Tax=Dendronalium phyllosphericum CENA369 TaxID=1725256 RepID=A0A8J7I4R0_9NOST|nr:DUF1338 domain-containing protein [Dendronalium phyllosphericum]MBH8574675.1 DUF1338 domain-containing protein [Dendronalium phyllosphericum CENA369]